MPRVPNTRGVLVAHGRESSIGDICQPCDPTFPFGHSAEIRGCYRASLMQRSSTPAQFNGVKVFSATMLPDRERLGDKITDWMSSHPDYRLVDIVVTQSSDMSFHCLAVTIFYFAKP